MFSSHITRSVFAPFLRKLWSGAFIFLMVELVNIFPGMDSTIRAVGLQSDVLNWNRDTDRNNLSRRRRNRAAGATTQGDRRLYPDAPRNVGDELFLSQGE